MSTPIPEKYSHRKSSRQNDNRSRWRMNIFGYLVAWLLPNALMAGIVLLLNVLPVAEQVGNLSPLLVTVGLAGLIVGLPLSVLVNYLLRFQRNHSVHVLAYALIGMLYGPAVLLQGMEGLVPLLIPLVGFPAAILMSLGRVLASPFVDLVSPEGEIIDDDNAEQQDANDDGAEVTDH